MKTKQTWISVVFAVAVISAALQVQLSAQFPPVDVGSDGSDGAINITTNTEYVLPEDGVINATTFTVAPGAALTFKKNAKNTLVKILAQGNVNIQGVIDISGANQSGLSPNGNNPPGPPGPGGFQGGDKAFGIGFGHGHGPGGDADHANSITTYASPLLIPLVGGSGGAANGPLNNAPGVTGGGGGGAILIASNTQVRVSGLIHSDQGLGVRDGPGSGYDGGRGAIRLVAPTLIVPNTGGNTLRAGLIRLDGFDLTGVTSNEIVGTTTRGANFVIEPDPAPTLDVTEVAGEAIPLGSGVALIQPPSTTDPNNTIKIRAENFGRVVPIQIVIQPNYSEKTVINETIDNTTNNPATKDINVTLPTNVTTRIYVWTRRE